MRNRSSTLSNHETPNHRLLTNPGRSCSYRNPLLPASCAPGLLDLLISSQGLEPGGLGGNSRSASGGFHTCRRCLSAWLSARQLHTPHRRQTGPCIDGGVIRSAAQFGRIHPTLCQAARRSAGLLWSFSGRHVISLPVSKVCSPSPHEIRTIRQGIHEPVPSDCTVHSNLGLPSGAPDAYSALADQFPRISPRPLLGLSLKAD